jgi:tRNA 2-thiouridine synthesizing protein A
MNPNLNELVAAKVADARGSACPGPLLEAKKAVGSVSIGQIVEVQSNDPGTRNDLPTWAQRVGHEYVGCLKADGYDRHFVRRTK